MKGFCAQNDEAVGRTRRGSSGPLAAQGGQEGDEPTTERGPIEWPGTALNRVNDGPRYCELWAAASTGRTSLAGMMAAKTIPAGVLRRLALKHANRPAIDALPTSPYAKAARARADDG